MILLASCLSKQLPGLMASHVSNRSASRRNILESRVKFSEFRYEVMSVWFTQSYGRLNDSLIICKVNWK